MKPLVGILLNRRILQRGVRKRSVFEKLNLYVKAAKELDVDVLFFETGGVNFKKERIVGYAPTTKGRLRRTVSPIPQVVHKRGLFRKRRDRSIIERLEERGVYLFNPEIAWDKYQIHNLLADNPLLLPYLPATTLLRRESFPWFKKELERVGEVFIKPCKGSLGIGIARVVRLRSNRYRFESRRVRKETTLRGAWRILRKGKGLRMLQEGIPLLQYSGRRVDLRVPVQQDGDHRWSIPGIAAKRAGRIPYLTNLAQGASVYNGQELLVQHFGPRKADTIIHEIKDVAIRVAQTLNHHSTRLVDLGLDIGVDADGHPHIIEVNRRDLRILLERSGQREAFATLYKNPVAYACSILHQNV